jgi:hypothetical protein
LEDNLELTYDNILEFMKRYYNSFPKFALRSENKNKMYEFYSPKIKVVINRSQLSVFNREEFLAFSAARPHIDERITPEHIIVDEKQKRVAVLVRTDFDFKGTGKKVSELLSAHYILELDEYKTIKIIELLMFPQPMPPGEPDMGALMEQAYEKSRKSKS